MAYNDNTKMPWGKHKGRPLGKLPAKYKMWLLTEANKSFMEPGLYEYFYDRAAEITLEYERTLDRRRNVQLKRP